MEKPCIRLQFHFTSERPVRCVAMLPIISSPFRVSRTSRSWKAKRLSATSSRDACRVAQHFSTGSSVTRRNLDNRQICIPSNRHLARQPAEDFRVLTAGRAKQDERRFLGVAYASRVLASASSRGNGDFDSPVHRRQASPRRTVRLNSCAPFLLALFSAW